MKHHIISIFKLITFWYLFFFVQRIIFLIFNYDKLDDVSLKEILLSNRYAFSLDISAICYLIAVPIILLIIHLFIRKKFIFKITTIFTIILVIINVLLCIGDIGLYLSWGSKINARALDSFTYPKETFGLIFSKNNIVLFILLITQLVCWIYFYLRFCAFNMGSNVSIIKKIVFSLSLITLLVIGIRGGIQKYPINKSWVYYSTNSTLNNAALNGFWNFAEILAHKQITSNPYNYLDNKKANEVVKNLYACSKDTTEMILNTNKPNIVLIILESFSAEAVECFGGEKGVTPGIDSLSKEGLIFPEFYATGFRTDQGLIAYLSGFPAQPQNTIIKDFGKFEKLPNLISTLKHNGYHTSYYCGGNLKFANTETYLKTAGIDKPIGEKDFFIKRRTLWGAYDKELFDFQLKDCRNNKQPFFSIIMTCTSHEGFEANVENIFGNRSNKEKYINTIHYTDKCLFEYIKEAQKQPWYNNTLFIITADHAHSLPKGRKYNTPERHHIPFMLYGNVLKKEYRGKKVEKISSQVDFPAIILSQLGIADNKFHWSKNVFNKYSQSFAFYTFDNGFGFITDDHQVIFDYNLKKVISGQNNEITEKGQAFMQVMFQEYLDLSTKK